jgi:hypothetical protein
VGIAVSGATDAARAAADIVLMNLGLSVIIDAIRESRKIFQRMTSYATYRIAETIRVFLFMTLSILAFDFYPVTDVMIVLLALLNAGAILSIAFDRARGSDEPVAWDMRSVLGVATTLGITGVLAFFGLFYLGERVFHFDRSLIQSLVYLKLSVARLDDLRYPYSWTLLVIPAVTSALRGGPWDSNRGDPHHRLWAFHVSNRMDMGFGGLGVRLGLVLRERPHQAGGVQVIRRQTRKRAGHDEEGVSIQRSSVSTETETARAGRGV